MITTERPIVLMGVAAKGAVDSALFFAMAAAFLVWGVIARSATATILTFAIMSTLMMLMARLIPLLPGAAALAEAHEGAPDGAVQLPWKRYAAQAAGLMVALSAFYVVLVVYLAPPALIAGLMTAYGVSCLRRLAAAREIERASGTRLTVRVQRSVWRTRAPTYYATPRLGV